MPKSWNFRVWLGNWHLNRGLPWQIGDFDTQVSALQSSNEWGASVLLAYSSTMRKWGATLKYPSSLKLIFLFSKLNWNFVGISSRNFHSKIVFFKKAVFSVSDLLRIILFFSCRLIIYFTTNGLHLFSLNYAKLFNQIKKIQSFHLQLSRLIESN